MNEKENRLQSVQSLAYLGDCIVELCVRSLLLERGLSHSRDLNRAALSFVSAIAQAEAMERILPLLTEAECAVFHRGRNAGHGQHPKGASVGEYRNATGMEALFGYLFMMKNEARITELFEIAYPKEEQNAN